MCSSQIHLEKANQQKGPGDAYILSKSTRLTKYSIAKIDKTLVTFRPYYPLVEPSDSVYKTRVQAAQRISKGKKQPERAEFPIV